MREKENSVWRCSSGRKHLSSIHMVLGSIVNTAKMKRKSYSEMKQLQTSQSRANLPSTVCWSSHKVSALSPHKDDSVATF